LSGYWPVAFIFAATLAAYGPALHGLFIWNDSDYITASGLRSLQGLWRIWFQVGATQQYYPVLHSLFWLEHRLWAESVVPYHLANLFLHATAACLFGVALRRLAVPGAWLAGAIFALHPVCVESVAWITEQKNTLSTVLYLGSALAYLRFDQERRGRQYLLAFGLFAAAALSKSVAATLPAALLVVLWWQRGRLSWRRDIAPLLPWLAFGAGVGLFTAWVERRYIGASGAQFTLSFTERCLVAGRAVWFYLGKALWPVDLMFIYPRWIVNAAAGWQYLFPASALALVAVLALLAVRSPVGRRNRGPLAALLFFVGSLFPTLGFLNVYAFLFSFVADHWQYLAILGIIAPVAAAWGNWTEATKGPLPSLVAAAALLLLGIQTWRESRMYRDIETLFRTTVEHNPTGWMANYNLGVLVAEQGHPEEAIGYFEATLKAKPEYSDAEVNWGNALMQKGDLPGAAAHYQASLQISPDNYEAHDHLGIALARLGRQQEALIQYEESIQLRPRIAETRSNFGVALARAGRLPEAIAQLQEAVRLKPDFTAAHKNLGILLRNAGRTEEAEAQFQIVSQLQASGPPAGR